jgi:hypothetical protein
MLRVVTIFVADGGTLEVQPGARVTFADVPFETAFDADQFGHGLIVFGTIRSVGTTKTPWTRLATGPLAGQRVVILDTPVVGWQMDDELVFGDSRALPTDDLIDWTAMPSKREDHTDVRRVLSLLPDGVTVTLDRALDYDHPGAIGYDGTLRLRPFVSNHTRDIVWRSEHPAGVRGHLMFTERADVNFAYNEVDDLGRTTSEPLDNTVWSGSTPTHIGTNQIAKYAVHDHHLIGPAVGPQPRLVGNAINRPAKWGISLHDTHYTTAAWNVIYGASGAGFVTETGQETENIIDHNFVVRTAGSTNRSADDITGTFGTRKDGFWFSGPNNHMTNNVSVDAEGRGFIVVQGISSGRTLRCSTGPGADPMTAEGGIDCRPDHQEVLQFDGNEAVASLDTGALFYTVAKIRPVTIDGFTAWHGHDSFRVSNSDSLTIAHLTIIGGDPGQRTDRLSGVRLDQNHDFTLRDPYIAGVRVGVSVLQPGYAQLDPAVWLTIAGESAAHLGEIHGNIGVDYERDTHNQPHGSQAQGVATLRDLLVTAEPTGGYPAYRYYFWQAPMDGMDVTVPWRWLNTHVNGRDSEVFSPEQGADAPMPTTGTWTDPRTGYTWLDLVGASTAGLTNAQAFAQEHVAYSNRVATCAVTDQVNGFECPQGEIPIDPKPHLLSVQAAAQPRTVLAGGSIAVSASVQDSTGCAVTAQWSAPAGTFVTATATQTSWTAPAAAVSVPLTVTVRCPTDGKTATDTISVTVNAPPVLNCIGTLVGTSSDGGKTVTQLPIKWACQ